MKKLFAGFGVLIVIAVLLAIGGFLWWRENTKPVSTNTAVMDFVITKGTNAEKVGQDLYAKGFIRSPFAFKLYVQLTDKTQKVQAGQFKLSPSYSMAQIVDSLSKGPTELWVTIPEGLRREEIVEKVISSLELTGTNADTFRSEFLAQTKDIEGFLFPDTYLFGRDVLASKVVSTLKNTFDKKVDEQMKKDITTSGRTLNQIVTMASLLERETKDKNAEERPIVAGILYKRQKKGWPLQVDAGVQYAIGTRDCKNTLTNCEWWKKNLTKEDLEINSPYNTYKDIGLPPTPIANPGLSALKAAISPQESEYWYYIHEPNGTIHYAKTLQEHNENVRVYLGK